LETKKIPLELKKLKIYIIKSYTKKMSIIKRLKKVVNSRPYKFVSLATTLDTIVTGYHMHAFDAVRMEGNELARWLVENYGIGLGLGILYLAYQSAYLFAGNLLYSLGRYVKRECKKLESKPNRKFFKVFVHTVWPINPLNYILYPCALEHFFGAYTWIHKYWFSNLVKGVQSTFSNPIYISHILFYSFILVYFFWCRFWHEKKVRKIMKKFKFNDDEKIERRIDRSNLSPEEKEGIKDFLIIEKHLFLLNELE